LGAQPTLKKTCHSERFCAQSYPGGGIAKLPMNCIRHEKAMRCRHDKFRLQLNRPMRYNSTKMNFRLQSLTLAGTLKHKCSKTPANIRLF